MVYKIVHNLVDLEFADFFHYYDVSPYHLRHDHPFKLKPPAICHSAVSTNFFANRVVSVWNNLDTYVVSSDSLAAFKSRLDEVEL